MAKQVQQRRDTTANLALTTPADGEMAVDTTRKSLAIGDGAIAGGVPLPNFAEQIRGAFTTFAATANGSPADPDDLTITCDARFAEFLVAADLPDHTRFTLFPPANNTDAVDLTIDYGSGTLKKNVKKITPSGLAELVANDFQSGGFYDVIYDGTQFVVIGGIGGGGGDFETVASGSISAQAQLDITGLAAGYLYRFEFWNIFGTTFADVYARFSDDGGSTFETASYSSSVFMMPSNSTTISGSTLTSAVKLTQDSSLNTEATYKAYMEVLGVFPAGFEAFIRSQYFGERGGQSRQGFGSGRHGTTDIDAIRFYPSSGNFSCDYRVSRQADGG